MSRRQSDADAETMTGESLGGQQAYWAGKPLDPAASEVWRAGWLAAAAEARRTLNEYKPQMLGQLDIRAALNEANAAIRQLMPAKATPRQRALASTAQSLIETALERLQPAAPAKAPTIARKPSARASRAGR